MYEDLSPASGIGSSPHTTHHLSQTGLDGAINTKVRTCLYLVWNLGKNLECF